MRLKVLSPIVVFAALIIQFCGVPAVMALEEFHVEGEGTEGYGRVAEDTGSPDPLPLIINAPKPITHMVRVQPIVTGRSDMSQTATFFGDATQQSTIEGLIDQIWAQVGIDVQWLAPVPYFNDFAYQGNPGNNNPRPTSDLSVMMATGPTNADPTVINMFFSNIVPGFSYTSLNTSNGLANVDSNGISMFVGSNLLTFEAGREVVAAVTAHEIGHNLGLDHIVEAFNLMQTGGSPNSGENLSAIQESIVFTDNGGTDGFDFLIPVVPEPSSALMAGIGILFLGSVRRRRV